MVSPRRALFSVSDKEGLVEFARGLHALGFELIGTEGTAKTLKDAGLPMLTVADYTGLREGLGGRVKTLHPKIFAGILAPRGDEKDLADLGAVPIDLVVVNLYPFETTVAKPDVRLEDAIENIDIGGVSLIRAAAKNAARVSVIVRHARYGEVLRALQEHRTIPEKLRSELAMEAFEYTSRYDAAIFNYLAKRQGSVLPPALRLAYDKVTALRDRESDEEGCPRRGHRAGVRAGRTRPPEIEEERNLPGPPDPRTVPARPRDRHGPCPRGRPPPDDGLSDAPARGLQGRYESLTDAGTAARYPLRNRREPVRQVEFDRPRQGRPNGRHRSRSDEPRGCVHARLPQGGRRGPRERRGQRRVLPVPGRRRRTRQRWRRDGGPARRLDPRRRGHRGGR